MFGVFSRGYARAYNGTGQQVLEITKRVREPGSTGLPFRTTGHAMSFTPHLSRQTRRRRRAGPWLAAALVAGLLTGAGCKSDERKAVDDTKELHEQVYETLKTHAGDTDAALRALRKREEDTRSQREELRKRGKAALDKLDEAERKAFQADVVKRHKAFATRLMAAIERFPENRRPEIMLLVRQLTH